MQAPTRCSRLCIATALAAAACGQAWAQKAGDIVLGAGVLTYAPNDKSTPLRFTQPVQREIPGSGSDVHSATTLGLNAHYFLTDHWAVEGVFGYPPRLKLSGEGSLQGIGQLGSARPYGPSLLGKYFFGQPNDKWRVGVGLGITYARFGSVHLTDGLQNALGAAIGVPPGASSTSAKIDSRFGPVFAAGFTYAFSETLGLTASLSYVRMKTQAVLTTTAGGQKVAESRTSLRLDPLVPFVYVTKKF
ncbi:OmpW family protein [Pseudorhodoferax sp. Leaf267]|uniref:OmpW/AlkL family protein n=1 Tax=Pseudorhodoferax sp. Leaf267 TaxID=1736316 RepID=UPI0007015DC2|nr:OmpW family outer membrane protein [Pseudorhodoferax sp. Leaf267]KQP21748.1 hypothetical protein ASF43_25945 [Pseudorhodoferax sp. Leaf267]